jgi:hypothetical protein
MRKKWMAVAMLALSSSVAFADTRYLSNAPGTWKPWQFIAYADPQRDLGVRPGELKELEAQLLRLNAILRKTPGISSPVGFSVETAGSLDFEPRLPGTGAGEPALTARPFPASLSFGAFPVMEFDSGKRSDTGEVAQVYFFINSLSQPLKADVSSRVPEFEKLDGDVVRMPPPQPDVMGFARYGDTLVFKKSAEPIWVAVTMGETLELVAKSIERRLVDERDVVARVQGSYDDMKDPKKREARLAEFRKIAAQMKNPTFMEQMTKVEAEKEKQADKLLPQIADAKAVVTKSEQALAGARAMAAGLSATDKVAAACYAINNVELARFRRAPAPGCDPLVRPNWKFFNPALPRTAPQLLTIGHFKRCLGDLSTYPHVGGCVANKRLIESLDKAALLAWLQ